MKYTRTLLIIAFTSVAQLFYGQERYTISGEFPDCSLDGEYVFLYDRSALAEEPERMKRAFKDTILVVGNTFHYEGTLNKRPFLASLSCSKGRRFRYNTSFVIEPGDIQLRIVDWGSEGNVSGTPINNDYNAYMHSIEGRLLFGEKYAQYPDVVRFWLAMYIDPVQPIAEDEAVLSRSLRVVDLMPKAERDNLLAWRAYRVKLKEHMAKVKALQDSMDANKPRFVEVLPNCSSSTTGN